jgi:acetyl esterase/lipase
MSRLISIAVNAISMTLCLSMQAADSRVTVLSAEHSSVMYPCPPSIPDSRHSAAFDRMRLMLKLLASSTIAPSDTSTSTVLSSNPSDQIVCGKASLKVMHDIVFSEPVLRTGMKKKLTMDIQIPAGAERRPVVVFLPGGGFMVAPKDSALDLRTYVAEAGFVVASIQYRTVGDGANYRDGVTDVKSAIRYLRAHADDYGINPHKVAVWGQSAGGYLAAMTGVTGNLKTFDDGDNLEQSSTVQAIIDQFGPSDMSKVAADFSVLTRIAYSLPGNPVVRYMNGPSNSKGLVDDPTAKTAANPMIYINASDPPFLLFHGSKDPLVSPSQTLLLHTALRNAHVRSTRYVVTGAGHGDVLVLGDARPGLLWSTTDVMRIIVHFLKKNLA